MRTKIRKSKQTHEHMNKSLIDPSLNFLHSNDADLAFLPSIRMDHVDCCVPRTSTAAVALGARFRSEDAKTG